jgi:hypothetical protein
MKKIFSVIGLVIVLAIVSVIGIRHHEMVKEVKAHGVDTIAIPAQVDSHYHSGGKRHHSSTDYTADFTYTVSGKTYHIESKHFNMRSSADKYLHSTVHARYLPKDPNKAILVDGPAKKL